MAAKFAFLETQDSPFTSEPIVPIDATHLLWKEKKMLQFCAQDTLGFSQQNDLKKNAMKFLLQFGMGTSFFRNLKESLPCQQQLQDKLAHLLGVEQTLLLPTRSSALSILLSRLSQPNSLLFVDEECHPMLLEIILAQKAQVIRFKHNDAVHLSELLNSTSHLGSFSRLIITESLFAMSGDIAPLQEIISLSEQSQCILIVDDSHAFGIKGEEGMGLAAQRSGIDLIIASLTESCGIPAAFIGCSKEIADYLMHAYPFWNEHAVAIPTMGAIDAALELILQMEGERRQLEHRSHWLRLQLKKLDFPINGSHSHLITLRYGNEDEANTLWQGLIEQDIFCELLCDRSLAAPSYKLRMNLNMLHTPEDLNRLFQALQISVKGFATVT